MKVGFVYDPVYLKHDTGQHPENAQRLEAIISHLEQTGLKGQLTPIKPRPATVKELALVHQEQHIAYIQEVAQRGGAWLAAGLTADTIMSADSYEVALYAAGGAIMATEAVLNGEVNSAFALVRPPGHHATRNRAMGFCLFNNIAIAARYALTQYRLERVVIIDFDVHHGNGTQDIFEADPRVLYISTHQYPHYPGTGSIDEIGRGAAQGTKVNIPLPPSSGDGEYLPVFAQIIVPVVKRFKPQLALVSAGYDSHWADPLAMMQVSITGFARMTEIIKELAEELCHGRIVLGLEGGYNPSSLATSVRATFDVLLGKRQIVDPLGPAQRPFSAPSLTPLIKALKEIHHLP